ncbi:MAG: iron-containing alcohol dehydrogenase [Leptospiraceae bacterium]|nr:iron-containing alcohol dehydrogenase [Leptospiraceae bacterium]
MFDWVHYQFPARLYFERDSTHKIGTFVREIGKRVLILAIQNEVSNPDELAVIKTSIEKHTTGAILYDDIIERPMADDLDTASYFIKQCNADTILAYGGRETFHAARSLALLSQNEVFAADIQDNLHALKKPPIPIVCVPNGPSMGEECVPVMGINFQRERNTWFNRDNRLYPGMVFVDPNVSASYSNPDMSRAGIAIMAASIETALSRFANEVTTSMALRSLELVARNLATLVNDASNQAARTHVSMASVLCGMAHSNSQLGLGYSIAIALSNVCGLHIETGMGILLPHIMEYNLTTSAGKYVQIAKALEEDIKDITVIEAAIKAVEGVRKIFMELKIPQRLSEFEIEKADLPMVADQVSHLQFTKNAQRVLDRNEIETILIAAY